MFYLLMIFTMHFLADFAIQTEWMALGKSKEWSPLLAHIGTYTAILLLFSSLFLPPLVAVLWTVSNGLCHLVVDYFSSRAMRRARESGQERKFFMILGLDQMLHFWCLFGILALLI